MALLTRLAEILEELVGDAMMVGWLVDTATLFYEPMALLFMTERERESMERERGATNEKILLCRVSLVVVENGSFFAWFACSR